MPVKRPVVPRFLNPDQLADATAVVLYPELIGLVLRAYRDRAGWRQSDLADALNWPQPKVSRIERGDAQLSVEQLDAIVETLNAALPLAGEDPIEHWQVLAQARKLADDLSPLGYAITWCSGPEWPGPHPLLRGDRLRGTLSLANVPFSV